MFRFRYRPLAELRANRSRFHLAKMAKYSTAFAVAALRGKRPLLDDPYASLAAPWIAEQFDGQAVVVVRHPAAMVASYRKLGYSAHPLHFLNQPPLMADYLEPWRAELEAVVDTDDRVAQVATFWRALHHVLLDMVERSERLHLVRYEDLCADPEGSLRGALRPRGRGVHRRRPGRGRRRDPSSRWEPNVHLAAVPPWRGVPNRLPADGLQEHDPGWQKTISPTEAARIRDIAGLVGGRLYGNSDWAYAGVERPLVPAPPSTSSAAG